MVEAGCGRSIDIHQMDGERTAICRRQADVARPQSPLLEALPTPCPGERVIAFWESGMRARLDVGDRLLLLAWQLYNYSKRLEMYAGQSSNLGYRWDARG